MIQAARRNGIKGMLSFRRCRRISRKPAGTEAIRNARAHRLRIMTGARKRPRAVMTMPSPQPIDETAAPSRLPTAETAAPSRLPITEAAALFWQWIASVFEDTEAVRKENASRKSPGNSAGMRSMADLPVTMDRVRPNTAPAAVNDSRILR